ncbi:hypothetical protein ACQKWADRAFT_223483 [Trichoderma austrokoningii]
MLWERVGVCFKFTRLLLVVSVSTDNLNCQKISNVIPRLIDSWLRPISRPVYILHPLPPMPARYVPSQGSSCSRHGNSSSRRAANRPQPQFSSSLAAHCYSY